MAQNYSINVDALAEMAAADDAPDFRVFIMQAAIKEVAAHVALWPRINGAIE